MAYQFATSSLELNQEKYILSDGSIIYCSLLDSSGTERFKSINESYFRKADGCILVYDITNKNSFNEIKNYYIPNIKEKCIKNIKTILLGNKNDREEDREVSKEEGIELSLKNNFIFKETSFSDNSGIFKAFETIIELTNLDSIKRGKRDNITIKINRKNHKKKKKNKKCC